MLENMLLLNWWVALGTIFLEIAVLFHFGLYLVFLFSSPETKVNLKNSILNNWYTKINVFGISTIEKYLLICIFLFSLFATALSLVYSEIFLQEPCSLCWWQRVFMYGIVVVSGTALYSGRELEQKGILKYILNFSILGAAFSLYQHAEQILALYGTHLPCPATSVDCSKMTLFEFSHITFPWVAFIMFALFISLILLFRKTTEAQK